MSEPDHAYGGKPPFLRSAPSPDKTKRKAMYAFFCCGLLLVLWTVGVSLCLYDQGVDPFLILAIVLPISSTLCWFLFHFKKRLYPAYAIAATIERFRYETPAVCREDRELLGMLLNQLKNRRKDPLSTVSYIDLVLHHLPCGVFCCGEDFKLHFISDGLLQLLGCTREQFPILYGELWKNVIYPGDYDAAMDQLKEQSATQQEHRLSYRIRRADNSLCWVLDSGTLTFSQDGTPEYVCILINNTEQKRFENRQVAVERQYRRALQSVCEVLIQVDLTNDHVLSQYGRWGADPRFPQGERYTHCCTTFMEECVHPDDRSAFRAAFCQKSLHQQNMDDESSVTYLEYRLKEPSGRYHWVAGTLVPLVDETTQNITAISYIVDIDERRRREDAFIDKSRRDGLTGLLNRTALFENIASCVEGAGQDGRHTLFMIDLDNFKAINDNFGHAFGDAVLREAADGIRSIFRPTDALARIGGDEFLVFLEHVDTPSLLARKAADLVKTLHKTYRDGDSIYQLSSSVGIAIYPDDGCDILSLFKSADAAMYAAKQRGKDGFSFSLEKMQTSESS